MKIPTVVWHGAAWWRKCLTPENLPLKYVQGSPTKKAFGWLLAIPGGFFDDQAHTREVIDTSLSSLGR